MLLFISVPCAILISLTPKTSQSIIKQRMAVKGGKDITSQPPLLQRAREFAVAGIVRPIHMRFTESTVSFICLYVAVNFSALFSFFAAVPYIVKTIYGFSTEQSELLFVAISVGSFLRLFTIFACDILLYRPKAAKLPARKSYLSIGSIRGITRDTMDFTTRTMFR